MKTPEEIKKGLDTCIGDDERCANCSYVCYGDCRAALEVDALKCIHQLESAQPKWISVEERLPEEGVMVLVYFDGVIATSEIVTMDMVDEKPMWSYMGAGGDPTHWMPLPEPPEEEE